MTTHAISCMYVENMCNILYVCREHMQYPVCMSRTHAISCMYVENKCNILYVCREHMQYPVCMSKMIEY